MRFLGREQELREAECAFEDLVCLVHIFRNRCVDILHIIIENIRMCDQRKEDIEDARYNDENIDIAV